MNSGARPDRAPTVRDLMRHTSGLAYHWEVPEAHLRERATQSPFVARMPCIDARAFVRDLAALPLMAQPGTRFRYGYSSDVLGMIVEMIDGVTLGQALRKRLFDPLGMRETGFEVPATHRGLVTPEPLKAMGRFNHEAACIDPRTGIAYLTEDRGDSLLYRFIPNEKGKLAKGGRLEALAFVETDIKDSRNWNEVQISKGKQHEVKWIPLDDPESPNDDLRKQGAAKGAALFARGEGIFWGKGELFFACTNGGAAKFGQIFRYVPAVNEGFFGESDAPGMIDLYMESTNAAFYNYGDNLCVMPNGHLMVCEDQYTNISDNHIRGVNGAGQTYMIAKARVQTEFAGGCFSPDGSTMFVNLMEPTMTLAIRGPWGRVKSA